MGRRTDGQEIDHHQFAVLVPAVPDKATLRIPAMRERVGAVEHPGPVHPLINLRGHPADFAVGKMLPAGQHAAKQQGRVDRRQLAVPDPLAVAHVDEVEKEAMLVRELVPKKPQGLGDAPAQVPARQVATFVGDAQRRQSKSSGGDAADDPRVGAIGAAAVLHQAGHWVGGFPEVKHGAAFQFVEEMVIGTGALQSGCRPDRARAGPGGESRQGQAAAQSRPAEHLAAGDPNGAFSAGASSASWVDHALMMRARGQWRQLDFPSRTWPVPASCWAHPS